MVNINFFGFGESFPSLVEMHTDLLPVLLIRLCKKGS